MDTAAKTALQIEKACLHKLIEVVPASRQRMFLITLLEDPSYGVLNAVKGDSQYYKVASVALAVLRHPPFDMDGMNWVNGSAQRLLRTELLRSDFQLREKTIYSHAMSTVVWVAKWVAMEFAIGIVSESSGECLMNPQREAIENAAKHAAIALSGGEWPIEMKFHYQWMFETLTEILRSPQGISEKVEN